MLSLLIAKLLLTILIMYCKEVVTHHLIWVSLRLRIVMINDLKLCTIVTNQEGRISFDEDHMRLDAGNPVIRVCDVVTLSHVHESTMSVHTGENVRASQRIQKLKRVCYSLLRSNILVVYIFGMIACLLSHVGRKSLYKYYISVCAHPLCSY